ncbi:MAG: hypothetical protein OEM59_10045 [Rhodospirillales bacterium]|nr:hypothetical protein [Rhodospirillales bacterium]
MRRDTIARLLGVAILLLGAAGCANRIPEDALQLSPESLQRRQAQSRYFDTRDEVAILSASAAVLQDLGFNLDESETELGLIVASKRRDATEVGQVVGAVVIAALLGTRVVTDDEQKIRVSLVTKPSGAERERITVRITFQRFIWDSDGDLSRVEAIDDPEIYQNFFTKLAKSVFLEANSI